jgi:hypothetical protein
MSLISLLVLVIILGLLIYVVQLLPLPPPFKTVAMVVVCLIAIVWLCESFGILGSGNLRLR